MSKAAVLPEAAASAVSAPVRHSALVRVTHWVAFLAFVALLVTGAEVFISHPRLYWGNAGNVNTPPLLSLPIPASRSSVPTGYGFVLPDQNGWSRYLHFEAGWVLVLAGALYLIFGFVSGHVRRHLWPPRGERSPRALLAAVRHHLRVARPPAAADGGYNTVQRLAYLMVVLGLFPMMVWTGLAMSPAMEGAFPWAVILLGGRQSARTLHFFIAVLLVLFLAGHVLMVALAGFRTHVTAMITGRFPSHGARE
jgi:thiosulfate reductase cytochrome b subunit